MNNLPLQLRRLSFAACLGIAALCSPPTQAAAPLPGIDAGSSFVVYYGADFSPSVLAALSAADVVVLHPDVSTVTPAVVAHLQNNGVSQVLGYLSIGEDAASQPVIVGDGTGPVYAGASGLVAQNAGYASFYVDDHYDGSQYVQDGLPDTNAVWGGRYVLPNSAWRDVLQEQRVGGSVAYPSRDMAGVSQVLGARVSDTDTDRTHDFGFDGLFLDTLGTAAPYVGVAGDYAWAAEEMSATVEWLHTSQPNAVLMANGGGYFVNPSDYNPVHDVHPFDFNIRPFIHAMVFESYRLDRHTGQASSFYADNRNNYAPKIIAESMRSDGFTVFTIDYGENASTAELDATLLASAADNGWTPYIAPDVLLGAVGTYAANNPPSTDLVGPVWDSTATGYAPIDVPDRVGVQQVLAGENPGEMVIEWDVARDQTGPVEFDVEIATLADMSDGILYANVTTQMGDGWDVDPFNAFPFSTTIVGLAPGEYFVNVQAVDGNGLNDGNTVVLSIPLDVDNSVSNDASGLTLDGDVSDWAGLVSFGQDPDDVPAAHDAYDVRELWAADASGTLFIGVEVDGSYINSWRNTMYFDTDTDRGTGYVGSGSLAVGAEYMLQGKHVYAYTGSGSNWSWSWVGGTNWSFAAGDGEFSFPLTYLGSPSTFDLMVRNASSPKDLMPDSAGQGASGESFRYAVSN